MVLPGDTLPLAYEHSCDDCDKRAVIILVGETDSFGSEYHYLCQKCHDKAKEADREWREKAHFCDWCKKEKTNCTYRRDYEEGRGGPVYMVCPDCWRKHSRAAQDLLDQMCYAEEGEPEVGSDDFWGWSFDD